jgi:uncharacterized membrane protein YjdF
MSQTIQDKFFNPRTIAVLVFTIAYTVAAIGGAFSRDNSEFLIYIGVMIVLLGIVGFVHYRVRLTVATLWAMSLWGLLHMAGGLVPVPESWPINGDIRVLYSWWIIPDRLKYDQVVHAYGFGVTTWVCWQALRAAVRPYGNLRPSFGVMTLCAVGGMGFGAANEIIEFVATLLVENTNVGDYNNTGWDLVSNGIGAVTAAVLISATHKPTAAKQGLRVERL